MKQRIITALILAPLVVWGIFSLPFTWFLLALAGITLVGAWEWTQFTHNQSRILALAPFTVVMLGSLVFIPSDVVTLNQITSNHLAMLSLGVAWWLFASVLTMTYPKSSNLWQHSNFLRHLFGVLTLLPFLWSILILRGHQYHVDSFYGAKLVLFVCLIVWAADSGAYFVGKSMGKHKMAPKVSPNKTIEGLVGGVLTAFVVAWASSELLNIQFSSLASMMFITLVTVVISVLGDLVESMFKRVSAIKDSSNIIPGHGGVLDRVDSLTAAFPIFALLYFTL